MQKTFGVFFLSMFLFTLAFKPAQALDVTIQPNGTVYFYDTRVLGETDEIKVEVKEEEKLKQEFRPTGVVQNTAAQTGKQMNLPPERKEEPKLLKVMPKSEQNQIRLKMENGRPAAILEKKPLNATGTNITDPRFERKESIESERIKFELPAAPSATTKEDPTVQNTLNRPVNALVKERIQERLEERKQRKDEKIEIQTEKFVDGSTEFQFESRNIKAKLRGAEFVLDPATNNVTITTPSGQQHTLNHLPDQAIAQMQKAGVIDSVSGDTTTDQVEITTKPDGTVAYQLKQKKQKRIFGFIPRTVETEVELNDETGDVVENTVVSENPFVRFFDSLAR
jgi:hypothetical protein